MMLNAHELYLLAETPDLRAATASTKSRRLRYRTRVTEQSRAEREDSTERLSIEHVAVLGEN